MRYVYRVNFSATPRESVISRSRTALSAPALVTRTYQSRERAEKLREKQRERERERKTDEHIRVHDTVLRL